MYNVKMIKLTGTDVQWCVVKDGHLAKLPCIYLKSLRLVGKSFYTQRSYAYALKLFSDYLETEKIEYTKVRISDLFKFLGWLRNPYSSGNVIPIKPSPPARMARTTNTYMSGVLGFYHHLYCLGLMEEDLSAQSRYVPGFTGTKKAYRDFLEHIDKGRNPARSILHIKEPKKRLTVLSPEQVKTLLDCCSNIRDEFLVYLLFVSALRIGELLSLYNEDIVFDLYNGHRIQLVDRGILPNGGKLKTGPRIIYINQHCLDLYDEYQYQMLDRFNKNSNFLFNKIAGTHIGEPMTYPDVISLFRRLSKKVGFNVHPHLLRHTSATIFYAQTKDAKQLQERLGHRDIETTLNFYVHLSDEEILTDWKKAATAFDF